MEEKCYGFTFARWLAAAGRKDSASEYDLRAAWRAGENPADYTRELRAIDDRARTMMDAADRQATWSCD